MISQLINISMPFITSVPTASLSTALNTATSMFTSIHLTATTPWPEPNGYLPGTFSRPNLAHQHGELVDVGSDPLAVYCDGRWYMKWLRTFIRNSWCRIWWLPPGSTTLPSRDVNINRVTGTVQTASWTVFISRPENAHVQIHSWATGPETSIVESTGLIRYGTVMAVPSCRTEVFPTFDTATATLVESACLQSSSWVYPTGEHWFSMTNTGSTTATVVAISSTAIAQLDQLLHAPTRQPESVWKPNW